MEAGWQDELVSEHSGNQRIDRGSVGILFVAGSSRSTGRDQFALAAVWDFEPVTGGGRFLCSDDNLGQAQTCALCVGDTRAARVAVCGDVYCGMGESDE